MKFMYPLILLSLISITSCNKSSDFFAKEDSSLTGNPSSPSLPEILVPPKSPETPEPPKSPEIPEPPKSPEIPEPPKSPEVPEPPKSPETPQPPMLPEVPGPPHPENQETVDEVVACKYNFSATSGGNNIKLTVISAPQSIIGLSEYKEFLALSPSEQDFVKSSVYKYPSNIRTVASKSTNQQTVSETLKIKSEKVASAKFNSIQDRLSIQYYLEGASANFSATSLGDSSKVILVIDAQESANVSFTSLHENSEVFIVFLAKGINDTCVESTGTKGEVASYVVGSLGKDASSKLSATKFGGESLITHSVFSQKNAVLNTSATSLASSQVFLSAHGEDSSHSKFSTTSIKDGVQVRVSQRAKGAASFEMNGTSVGRDTYVGLDIISQLKATASFGFTNHSNIEIEGQLQAPTTDLILDSRLKSSKTARINVTR